MYKIIVIEDDVMMSSMLAMYLIEEGFEVKQASTGEAGIELIKQFTPDLVLLDLILPDVDGLTVCETIRQLSAVPIMILSTKNEVSERVQALRAGADDYLCKPFSMHELTARVEAILRRSMHLSHLHDINPTPKTQDIIELDHDRRILIVRGVPVETTFSEYEIMRLFLSSPNKVFSRDELISALRGFDSFVTERSIDVHIVNLRKKVELNPKEPQMIKTVWGFGYKYTT